MESSNDEVEAAKKYLEQSKAMQEYQDKRKEAIREYNKLSWIDKVKLDPNRLDRLKKEQLERFDIIIKRRRPELKDKIDEMFVEYWEKLLSEDVKSINEYLQSID